MSASAAARATEPRAVPRRRPGGPAAQPTPPSPRLRVVATPAQARTPLALRPGVTR